MAGQKNPFDQFDNAPSRQVIVTKPADPKLRYEGPRAASEAAIAAAQAQNAPSIQAADARIKNAQAAEIERKNAELAAEDAATKIRPTGKLTIDQVPAAARPIVSAMLAGNLPVGARSVTSPQMLPYLQMAVNIDPNFSAATFPARAAAMKQLADMKSTGGYLTSLAANIDHSKEEEAAIQRLNNPSGLYGRFGGASLHNWLVNKGGPAGAQFDQANRVYSGEQVKSIVGNVGSAGGGSALADRQDAERAISASMPIDAQRAALRVGAMQNYQKYRDADQGFMRTMGTHIPSPLSQEQAAQLLHLMRLQEDGTEGPVPKEVDPAFVALAQGNPPPPPGAGGGSGGGGQGGGLNKTNTLFDPTGGGGGSGGVGLASGGTKTEYDPQVSGLLDMMIRRGASADEINARLKPIGADPVDPALVSSAQAYLKLHPDYKGSLGEATRGMRLSAFGQFRNDAAQSPFGTLMAHAGNAVTFDNLDSIVGATGGNAALTRAGLAETGRMNPKSGLAGDIGGGLLAAGGLEAGSAALGARLGIASPWLTRGADALYGGLEGAGANDDNRLLGAGLGAVAGTAGGMFGRQVIAPAVAAPIRAIAGSKLGQGVINGVRDARGLPALAPPPSALSAPDRTIMSAAQKAGIPDIQAQLAEAQSLKVPMSLADTHPELTSLTGAAVRRSPTADAFAQSALIPRARGQVDRLGQAIDSNLGPVGNIPQTSADLTKSAKVNAKPLYDQAYTAGQVNDPVINQLLEHPELKAAFDAAQQHHANDVALALARGENPPPPLSQAYTLDANNPSGYRVTTPPDVRTIDYIKRGLDSRIQSAYSGNDSQAAMSGGFLKDAKNLLLKRTDTAVPAYGAARAAYGGPMQADEALQFGKNSISPSVTPNQLGVDLANIAPGDLPQAQLGQRSALMDTAGNSQYSRNPFSLLNTPNMEQKIGALYPDNPGVPNLLRTRDLEGGLARTTNDILGNSKTAQRGIADEAFNGNELAQTALDLGMNVATGQIPIGTMVKGVGKLGLKDYMKLGMGKQAEAKANAIIPTLLNTDPAQSSDALTSLVNSSQAYRDLISRYKRGAGLPSGMFGAAVGGSAPGYFGSQ